MEVKRGAGCRRLSASPSGCPATAPRSTLSRCCGACSPWMRSRGTTACRCRRWRSASRCTRPAPPRCSCRSAPPRSCAKSHSTTSRRYRTTAPWSSSPSARAPTRTPGRSCTAAAPSSGHGASRRRAAASRTSSAASFPVARRHFSRWRSATTTRLARSGSCACPSSSEASSSWRAPSRRRSRRRWHETRRRVPLPMGNTILVRRSQPPTRLLAACHA